MREPFKTARSWFTIFLVLEVLLGIGIVAVTFTYQYIFTLYLSTSDRALIFSLLFGVYTLGLQLALTYICSLALWRRIWLRRFTSNLSLMINIWMFFCFLIIIFGVGTIWSLYNCVNAMVITAEKSLRKGIDLYYTCPEWKLLWDSLQYHKECCGIFGFEDWSHAQWMPPEETTECPKGNASVILAPYACCKQDSPQCFEKYMPHLDNQIPSLQLGQINTVGCLHHFASELWSCVYSQMVLILIALKIDFVICLFTKYIISKQTPSIQIYSGEDEDGKSLLCVKCPSDMRCEFNMDDDDDECGCSSNKNNGKKKRSKFKRNIRSNDDGISCQCESCLKLNANILH